MEGVTHMRITLVGLMALAALFLVIGARSSGQIEASHPTTPQPLLYCADVNGDTAVAVGDISRVVARFGANDATYTATATYHPLYDLNPAGTGAITVQDITTVVSDFGLNCGLVSPVDTQVAQATVAMLNIADVPGGPVCNFTALLTENVTCLAEHGYYRSSTDVPGQGVHYVSDDYWDGLFNLNPPEGMIYNNGRLVAQLYYVEGDNTTGDGDPSKGGVGWGPEPLPSPPNQIQIDSFCVPNPPNTVCSWAGTRDTWHLHYDLCTVAIGTPQAAAIPGVASQAQCDNLQNGGWPPCGGPCGGTHEWDMRVGWMGHLWNHQLNPNSNPNDPSGGPFGNGRFADCAPDVEHWGSYTCPQ
jgi:hypothetical protein